jgi:hypothetical protein
MIKSYSSIIKATHRNIDLKGENAYFYRQILKLKHKPIEIDYPYYH